MKIHAMGAKLVRADLRTVRWTGSSVKLIVAFFAIASNLSKTVILKVKLMI
jgi:hypothetical protein